MAETLVYYNRLQENNIVSKSSNYTATKNDHTIKCDSSAGAITIQLPSAIQILGKEFVIIKTDSTTNTVIVDGDASETISGNTTFTLSGQWDSVAIRSDSTNWFIVGKTDIITPSFHVHRNNVNQSIPDSTSTKILWTTEDFDTNDNFDSSTNYRFTPTIPGKYLFVLNCQFDTGTVDQTYYVFSIYKNGTTYLQSRMSTSGTGWQGHSNSVIVNANGTSDYFETFVEQGSGGALNLRGIVTLTNFSGCRIGD